jgi:hypothetical protein
LATLNERRKNESIERVEHVAIYYTVKAREHEPEVSFDELLAQEGMTFKEAGEGEVEFEQD